jgi:hypothetical protein
MAVIIESRVIPWEDGSWGVGLVDTFRTLCIDPTAEIRATFDMMRASGSPF